MFKIIDCRTRETVISRLCAQSHTDAEARAKEMLPGIYTSASMLTPSRIDRTTKKRTRKQ